MKKREEILRILGPGVRRILEKADPDTEKLQEIRLRVGGPLLIVCKGREYALTAEGNMAETIRQAYVVTEQDFKETLQIVSSHSLYAFEDEVKQGFLTVNGGHRVGIAGRAILEKGRVKSFKYITCMNIRVAHEVTGCAGLVMPYVTENGHACSSLIISPPRCGKTTLLRDMIRQFSNGTERIRGQTVGVVDERSEIGGCYMGIPQNDVGARTDILDCCPKAEGMMLLIRSMAPDIVAVDEIGDERDADALFSVVHCGCRLLATVHGSSLEEVRSKPFFAKLINGGVFDRFVLLSERRMGQLKAVYDGGGSLLYQR